MARAGEIIREYDLRGVGEVTLNGTQSITNSTTTAVQFNDVGRDSSSMWDPSSFQFRIPPGLGGLYAFSAGVSFATSSTGYRWYRFQVNGERWVQVLNPSSDSGLTRLNIGSQAFLSPGDSVQAIVFQNSGGSLNISGSADGITFMKLAFIRQMTFGVDND